MGQSARGNRPTTGSPFEITGDQVLRVLRERFESGCELPCHMTHPDCPHVLHSVMHVATLDEAAALAEGVLAYQPNNLEALLVLAAAQANRVWSAALEPPAG